MNTVEIAVKMETDAVTFYKEASDKTRNAVGKKMFLSIAEDEKRHLEMLSELLKGLDLTMRETNPLKNMATIFEEMKAVMMQRAEVTADELEAFKIAMEMEKEGKEFYEKAAQSAPTEKERKLFEKLVIEEEQHYAVFSNTYNFMKDTGNWFMWEEHGIVDGGTPWA
ncbi:MAG: ferritin family protein [Nitrospirae bacterium]|nr:ferritin family protein [Nitrospirota bacterium]MCL5237877.1 ferritin family protein [Nitrospirota bacterium]